MLELNLKPVRSTAVEVTLGDEHTSHTFDPWTLALDSEVKFFAFHDDPASYGEKVFAALFPPGSPAAEALNRLPKPGQIVLVAHDRSLDALPWESAHDGKSLLAARHAFLRCLPPEERPALNGFPAIERLPLYFLPANPLLSGDETLIPLNTETEWRLLRDCVESGRAAVNLTKLLPPTADSLQKALLSPHPCLVHYFGHGNVDRESGRAELLFESETGRLQPLDADGFVERVRGKAALVFLGACLSAAGGRGEDANLARLLVREGIPFAIGMQFIVMVRTAERVTDFFYRALLAGNDAPEAMRQARLMMQDKDLFQAGIPVLYAARPEAALPPLPPGEPQVLEPHPYAGGRLQVSRLPLPEMGFLGRQRELVEIGERLKDAHPPFILTLHGIGGTGKTALLRAALERFAWRYPYGALAIPLEPMPDLASLLVQLEHFTGLPDDPALDLPARAARLLDRLAGQPLLLALDNFESLLHARDGKDKERAAQARDLFAFFRQLPARGVTLLVTSREKTGLPSETLLDIRGLQDMFGGLLFLGLCSSRRSDLELDDAASISRAVRGHPLALRLLAPAFDNDRALSAQDFLDKLDEILPAAEDAWAEGADRHSGLRACFDYSFSRLPDDLKPALARLSLFHGQFPAWLAAPALLGKDFDIERQAEAFQRADGLLHDLWGRGLLEDAPLLVQGAKGIEPYHFYSLHPALRPFAVEQLQEERAEAEQGFWLAMRALGQRSYPHSEGEHWAGIQSDPLLAETARRALPDLRRAAALKSETGRRRIEPVLSHRLPPDPLWRPGRGDETLPAVARNQGRPGRPARQIRHAGDACPGAYCPRRARSGPARFADFSANPLPNWRRPRRAESGRHPCRLARADGGRRIRWFMEKSNRTGSAGMALPILRTGARHERRTIHHHGHPGCPPKETRSPAVLRSRRQNGCRPRRAGRVPRVGQSPPAPDDRRCERRPRLPAPRLAGNHPRPAH